MATTAPISNPISHPTSHLISALFTANSEVRHFIRSCAHGITWAIISPALKLIAAGISPEEHDE